MRVLIDYRPALRERTGAGEYVHQMAAALARRSGDVDLAIFSSSWKDRLRADHDLAGVTVVDARIPGKLLNYAWHRLEWPNVELVARRSFDVVHAAHPLLIPSGRAAQVVTIHDLHFLDRPEHTSAEIRRDYVPLARAHAERADMIVVSSQYTGRLIRERFDLSHDRITLCRPGAPAWGAEVAADREPRDIVFLGTLEPRKNVGVLLDAYERLLAAGAGVPDLVLAGKATNLATEWLTRMRRAPLAGRVRHLGYVDAAQRLELFRTARLLVMPSLDEGFGFPVLEAMSCGVPVIASTRGSLPEVTGDAALLVEPDDVDAWAAAMQRMIEDEAISAAASAKGRLRAEQMTWDHAAESMRQAYEGALAFRRGRPSGRPGRAR